MRIAIFSDPHMGFGYGTERFEDAFDAFKEAIEISEHSDLLIIPGDIFDNKNPTTDVLSKAMELLLTLRMSRSGASLVEGIDRRITEISPANTLGMPVIALHGNHERRARGLVNPVQALEKAGLLIHVHCNGLVFQKEGERIAIQGMSAVPDQYAKEVLKQWNPQPIVGAFNILMMHQVFSEFFQSPGSISASVLPDGFDIYLDGDIHKPARGFYNGKPFIISGALIPTQLNKDETEPKGVWFLNTTSKELRFQPLQKQREFHYLEYKIPNREKMQNDIEKILSQPHDKLPIIRIKVLEDFDWKTEMETRYHGKALLSFRKKTNESPIKGISLTEHIASVEETASRLLRENLTKAGLVPKDLEQVFELLVEKKHDEALKMVMENAGKVKSPKTGS